MLRIIKSGFYSAGKERLISEIEKLSAEGKRSLLIVPEQQTVLTEGILSRVIPPSASTVFEVTNFTRLANMVFRALGGLSGEYCDSAKSALIMWRTLTELSPVLTITASKREVNAGLVGSMLRAVAEMQSLSIPPASLAEAAEAVKSDRRLSDKLSDLSKIFTLYKKLLSEKYADSGDDAEAMITKLSENPGFLSDTTIFVEGFTSFTEPQYKLLGLLAARTELTVHLTVSPGREDAFEFTELFECAERLTRTARRAGAEIKLLKEEGYPKKQNASLAEICAELWSVSSKFDNISLQSADSLRIFEAQTPYDECEFICSDIRRRVMAGAAYSDFAIVTRSSDKYAGILDCALDRAEIPAFSSFRRDVSEFEAIKFIYSAYSAIRGFSREDVITYAKCPLSGITREECDELEAYVNKWQINGKLFTDGELWSMNPQGYTTDRPEGTDEKLKRINLTKEKLISPLLRFEKMTSSAKTAREQTQVLLDFLLELNAEEMLERRAELLDSFGEHKLADENRALWGIIINAMDSLYEVLGDTPCDAEAFLSQLKAALSTADVGSIPAFSDVVTVGRADMLRLNGKPHIYMIGINAGEFPAAVSDNSFFTEHDKETLFGLGLSMKPEIKVKDARELYIFSRVFSYAEETVTLSYSSCNTKFKSTPRAEVIDKITALTGGAVKPRKIAELPLRERIFSVGDAISEIGNLGESYGAVRDALVASGREREVNISESSVANSGLRLGREMLDTLYSKPLYLSQTKIDKYVSCPFGHFCKHTLELSRDERAEWNSANIGTFIHSILENFFRALSESGKRSSELSREERVSLTRLAARKYIDEMGDSAPAASAMVKVKIDRLSRAALPVVDGLCDEFSESLFEPKFFELRLSNDDASPSPVSLDSDGGRVIVRGIIDRVDTYKKDGNVYIRVVDYKTGQKEFSPSDMEEGKNLQMFLYLKSLIDTDKEKFKESVGLGDGGRLIPAGVVYVKTAVGDVRVDLPDDKLAEDAVKENQKREGMVLDDEDIISAMGMKYTPLTVSSRSGALTDSSKKLLFSEEGFGEIMQTVENSVMRVADGIRAGEICASPKPNGNKLPCEYCEFKPICRASAK